MLGLAVPFGLLPASDPRLLRTAESILRANDALKGDPNVLARIDLRADAIGPLGRLDSDQHEVSSLATLWMVRFLIQLGRETGQARHWTRALVDARGDPRPALSAWAVAASSPAAAWNRPGRSPTRAGPPGDCTPC